MRVGVVFLCAFVGCLMLWLYILKIAVRNVGFEAVGTGVGAVKLRFRRMGSLNWGVFCGSKKEFQVPKFGVRERFKRGT